MFVHTLGTDSERSIGRVLSHHLSISVVCAYPMIFIEALRIVE